MKKRLIAPLTAITVGAYSVLHVLFTEAATWLVAVQVLFGLLLVIVGLCLLDDALDTLKKEERNAALKKEIEDQVHKEALQRKAEQLMREGGI